MKAFCANTMTGPILHLSADFPDTIDAAKTKAIQTLVSLVADRVDQQVISLNRIAPGPALTLAILMGRRPVVDRIEEADGLTCVGYLAPGKGLWHHTMLEKLVDALCDHIGRGPRPALIMGHKLTVEGIVAARIAQRLGVPYGLTLQGDTDTKILTARPDLRGTFARIFRGAAVVFSLAPWSLQAVEAKLGRAAGPTFMLPCPLACDRFLAPRIGGNGIITAFHLRNAARKNLARLIDAHQSLRHSMPDIELAIVGGGSAADYQKVEQLIGPRKGVRLCGAIDNARIPDVFNAAIGFAMPSLRESFGMVFIEALFAGTPIVYPKGQAIDGYFEDQPFAIAVNPKDPAAIADGLARLVRDEASRKSALALWQLTEAATRFRRDAIADVFARGMAAAMMPAPISAPPISAPPISAPPISAPPISAPTTSMNGHIA